MSFQTRIEDGILLEFYLELPRPEFALAPRQIKFRFLTLLHGASVCDIKLYMVYAPTINLGASLTSDLIEYLTTNSIIKTVGQQKVRSLSRL